MPAMAQIYPLHILIASLAAMLFGGACAWVLSLPTAAMPQRTVAVAVTPVERGASFTPGWPRSQTSR